MKILFLISGYRVPASRFRVLSFVPHLRRMGHRCQVLPSFPEKYVHFPTIGFRPSQLLKRLVRMWHLVRAWAGSYDVIFLEREIFDDNTSTMEARFRRTTRTMILDVDDGIFLRYPEKFDRLVEMCDFVIAGNRFLKEKIEPTNPNVCVIPTCVDMQSYRLKQGTTAAGGKPIIGWIGTTLNLHYLEVVAPALRSLAKRCDFALRLIAGADGPLASIDLKGVDVQFVRWRRDTEIDELLQLDIGMMPLFADQQWNIYKCGAKLIQYMAVGIPGVASPIGVNAEIVEHGKNGFLASKTNEWEEILFELVNNPQLRISIGEAGRQTVQQHYSTEANLPKLVRCLETAVERSATRDER